MFKGKNVLLKVAFLPNFDVRPPKSVIGCRLSELFMCNQTYLWNKLSSKRFKGIEAIKNKTANMSSS